MSPADELQTFIIGRLRADVGVTAICGERVYDNAPSGVEHPYVSLGPTDVVPDDYECISTREEVIQIDCWSQQQGSKLEAKTLVDAVKAALHDASGDLGQHALIYMNVTLMRVLDDPDGITAHGVVQLACGVEEN